MFTNIPPKRLLMYLMLLGTLPFMLVGLSLSSSFNQLNQIQNKLFSIQQAAFLKETKQSSNIAVIHHFHDTDHFYIDKNLETLSFLEQEIESLKQALDNPNFPADETLKKRIDFLSHNENKLMFTEGVVQSTPLFQEVTETLTHPVEINVLDIQKLLCRIEGVSINGCMPPPNRPQFIILDFKIDKKNTPNNNEVFSLNLKLLKREFL